jgi:hypothetical protein
VEAEFIHAASVYGAGFLIWGSCMIACLLRVITSRARPGKGRTGCVICCHLLHAGLHPRASEAMAAYEASLDPCLNTPYGIP